MSLSGTDLEKLSELATYTYKDQAIWFLNAYWDRVENEAEKFWLYVEKIAELDLAKKKEGNEVDEMQAHRFLEAFHMTQTVREMRDRLRKIGITKVRMISLIHIIMFYYDVDYIELVNASQGDTSAELEAAKALLEEVQTALAAMQETAAAAKEAEAAAKAAAEASKEAEAASLAAEASAKEAEAEAKASEAEALSKEADARAAQAELEAALAELHAQEEAYNNKTKDLERKSEEGGIVSRNRAKNELAQHLGEDPLPLRRAKLNQEAAVRKAEKATAAATAAREVAEADRKQAEENRAKAEQAAAEATAAREQAEAAAAEAEAATAEAEAAVEELVQRVAEAEKAIEEAAKTAGSGGKGTMWWMQRQLTEDKKYLPSSRGGIAK